MKILLPVITSILALKIVGCETVSIQDTIVRKLVLPEDISYKDDSWWHLGMVVANVKPETMYFVDRLDPVVRSVISFNSVKPIHLVFISDESSFKFIAARVEKTIAEVLIKRILFHNEGWKMRKYRIPKFRIEFADMNSIVTRYRESIDHLKTRFNVIEKYEVGIDGAQQIWGFTPVDKYSHDLFYISPFYHLVFPFEKFGIIDVDIEFKHSINLLFEQFNNFNQKQLYAFGKDMSPLYRTLLYQYRKENPKTLLGEPGALQGVNTGVVLLHLERMRNSKEVDMFLNATNLDTLCDKFHFKGFIGDQDWWNIVVWERPDLYYNLDCSLNFQLKKEFNTPPFDTLFDLYHNCESKMVIQHGHNM